MLEQCGAQACVVRSEGDDPKRWKALEEAARTKKIPTGTKLCVSSSDRWRDNEGGVTEGEGTKVNLVVDGLKTNINSCDIYTTEFTCGVAPNCTWLSMSKKCVESSSSYIPELPFKQSTEIADTSAKGDPTTQWQRAYDDSVSTTITDDKARVGVGGLNSMYNSLDGCGSYSLTNCPFSKCMVVGGKCVKK